MIPVDTLLFVLKLFSALGSGLIAGVFFAFSSFVMTALARLSPAQGVAAMQSINVAVINPVFMTAFLGTGVACFFLTGYSLLRESGAAYLMVGSLLYLVGTVGVTLVFNVPLNDALARVEPGSADGARLWATYLADWTMWNHVRTGAALGASALLILALRE